MAKKRVELDAKGHPKFGIRDKLAYAAGDAGCNLSFGLKNTVQTFWLVYMMMETGLFSLLLVLVQAWDAINDPLIGSLIDSDRRIYKRGKYKTYILIGACGLLVGGAAVFMPFPNATTVVKAMLFIVGYVIWDAAYTTANVPYGTMLNIVTENTEERAALSVFRSIGGAVGNMLPGIILPMLIWKKVTYDGTTWFLDKIEIPEEAYRRLCSRKLPYQSRHRRGLSDGRQGAQSPDRRPAGSPAGRESVLRRPDHGRDRLRVLPVHAEEHHHPR